MIQYRPFLNSDPPAIAEIWRSQSPSRALIQFMTPAVLDDLVFSKPFFDRQGLIMAVEDGKPIGFVHAGFGPNKELGSIDYTRGTTALLLVSPHRDHEAIALELLARSEQYLRQRGATTLFGGATNTLAPFYFGLYGGSRLSGVLASDTASADLFRQTGYTEATNSTILRCDLMDFRAPVDRELMQVRRKFQLEQRTDSPIQNWWEACEFAMFERVGFALLPKGGGVAVAEATFWDVEPLASSWGVRTMGLLSVEVGEVANACAVAMYFIAEIFRQFQSLGTALAEFQLRADETLAMKACQKLGFDELDQGLLFQKPATA